MKNHRNIPEEAGNETFRLIDGIFGSLAMGKANYAAAFCYLRFIPFRLLMALSALVTSPLAGPVAWRNRRLRSRI